MNIALKGAIEGIVTPEHRTTYGGGTYLAPGVATGCG